MDGETNRHMKTLNKIRHVYWLWKIKRMIAESARLGRELDALDYEIEQLGEVIDQWEEENVKLPY